MKISLDHENLRPWTFGAIQQRLLYLSCTPDSALLIYLQWNFEHLYFLVMSINNNSNAAT